MIGALLLLKLLDPLPALPPLTREFRGTWIATVDNIDWPSKRGLSTTAQKTELLKCLDAAQHAHLNAVLLQVRPSCDALYSSSLEPWSEYLTGQQGTAPDPFWDPLTFAIDESHKRGLELHAWLNPFRAWHPAAKGAPAANYIGSANPSITKAYGKYQWLDPGEPASREHTLAVVSDIVKRYDLDGIHIDDYFYPYPVKGSPFPDAESFEKSKSLSAGLSKSQWRRANIDDFVRDLYGTIKKIKPWVKFGISPFGIYRPGVPEGIKSGIDQFEDLSADARKWLANGWCDYFSPQLYWPIDQTAQEYGKLLEWWVQQNKMGRSLWPGNFTGKVFKENGGWPAKEIVDQVELTRRDGATGNVHYSLKSFTKNPGNIVDALLSGPYEGLAAVPAMPWISKAKPTSPQIQSFGSELVCSIPLDEQRWQAIFELRGGTWKLNQISGERRLVVPKAGCEAIASIGLSRCGVASDPTVLDLRSDHN